MRVVHKYPLDGTDVPLRLPVGAEVLHALPPGDVVHHLGSLKSDEAGSFIFHVWERL